MVILMNKTKSFFEEQMNYDYKRTVLLEKYNLKVLRFTNLEIDKDFYGVCTIIDKEVKSSIDNG